jgi:hypothetical protein
MLPFFSLLSASLTDYDGRALVTVVDGQRGSCGVVRDDGAG